MHATEHQKTALLIGGSYSALPLGELIHNSGFKLIILTSNPNEPATYFADRVIVADYSNHQESLDALRSERFDYVIPSCNDSSYLLGARLAEMFKLPGFDSFEICNLISSKRAFRDLAISIGIPSPLAFSESDITNDFNQYPIIVKPNQSFSGRGISIVTESSQLAEAFEQARNHSKDKKIAIESFINGSLHSVSAFMRNGTTKISFFVDEFCTVYPFQVNNSNYPSILKNDVKTKVLSSLDRLISELGLVEGLVHLQFMVQENDVYFIEIMRRCPGDLFGHLFKYAIGFDYYRAYLSTFLGYPFIDEVPELVQFSQYVARSTETSNHARIFLSIASKITDTEIFPLASSGDRILPAPFGKTAITFFLTDNCDTLRKIYPNFDAALKVSSLRIGE